MRLTITCPASLIPDANHLAMVLGYGPADAGTYGALGWQDAGGNLYTAASLEVSPVFVGAATRPLVRPEWDVDNTVNMAAAGRAQARVVIWQDGEADPVAAPGVILAMFHPDPLAVLELSGVARIEVEP